MKLKLNHITLGELKEAAARLLTTEAVTGLVDAVEMGAYYDGTPKRLVPLMCALTYAKEAVAVALCLTLGHDLEGDGWAGPDSGGDGCHCKRCGWGWSVTLY